MFSTSMARSHRARKHRSTSLWQIIDVDLVDRLREPTPRSSGGRSAVHTSIGTPERPPRQPLAKVRGSSSARADEGGGTSTQPESECHKCRNTLIENHVSANPLFPRSRDRQRSATRPRSDDNVREAEQTHSSNRVVEKVADADTAPTIRPYR